MTQMIEVKTAELIGPALDWAVGKALGYTDLRKNPHPFDDALVMTPPRKEYGPVLLADLAFSTDWSQGGPLIEEHGIGVARFFEPIDGPIAAGQECAALSLDDSVLCGGPTPLIAAMRCLVASKLGEVVMVPAELVTAIQ